MRGALDPPLPRTLSRFRWAIGMGIVWAIAAATAWAQSPTGSGRAVSDNRNLLVQPVALPTTETGRNQGRRIALVIGNAAYKDAPLTNPVNDARAIAQALSLIHI